MTLVACEGNSNGGTKTASNEQKEDAHGAVDIVVLADPHIYDTKLGVSGEAFANYLVQDTKMLVESGDIFGALVESIVNSQHRPDIIIIAGDLTKDGELSSHQLFVTYLNQLRDAGITVLLVPGNHDIANPHAFAYPGESTKPVKNLCADDFRLLYFDYGYDDAIFWDPDSLSYIVEPRPGFWIFAIDSNRYRENDAYPVHGGAISSYTEEWIVEHLQKAQQKGVQALAMLHHPILEHAVGKSQYSDDLLLHDWDRIGRRFSESGLRVILSGHSHCHTITRRDWQNGHYLYEIQTGSLVSYPNPYRRIQLDRAMGRLGVSTQYISQTNIEDKIKLDPYESFEKLALFRTEQGIRFNARKLVSGHLGYDLEPDDAIINNVVEAVMAFISGDPSPSARTFLRALKLANSANELESEVGMMILSLWSGQPPDDLNVNIYL
ncbi:metallophosphoesterase [Halorhodospira halochloris]|uniref:metallophosphoesterase family protein n=1 Tax=Halorhodospira halochloris TaxID=1052 RepID=UPI001EE8DE75|nr:metallophosphoesterase [Halorhodospira halochloris]MCG5531040.1 metallophosphoesterase [Halorhodospira halochloris]